MAVKKKASNNRKTDLSKIGNVLENTIHTSVNLFTVGKSNVTGISKSNRI